MAKSTHQEALTDLDTLQSVIDKCLVDVRALEVRTRSDDRVQQFKDRLLALEYDRQQLSAQIVRIKEFVGRLQAVSAMLDVALNDVNTDIAVHESALKTYGVDGYTATVVIKDEVGA